MKVIVFQDEAYQNLLKDIESMIQKAVNTSSPKKKEKEWITESEAKDLLGFRSKTKMQQLRDDREIVFSQHGRTIMYSRKSIQAFLEENARR